RNATSVSYADRPGCSFTPMLAVTALRYQLGIAERSQVHEPHAVGKSGQQLICDLQRKPRFAHTAGSGERKQAGPPEKALDFRDLTLASNESRELNGKVVEASRVARCGSGMATGQCLI